MPHRRPAHESFRAGSVGSRPLLRAAALLGACGLLAIGTAAPALAHDGSENGLTRPGGEQVGPVTEQAVAELADFQRRAELGQFARVAAEDPVVTPTYVSSPNVTYVGTLPQTADGVGARVVGNRLFVTSTKDLQIFDITDPAIPDLLGSITLNVEFENEQVPTDGKVLGISGQTPTVNSARGVRLILPVDLRWLSGPVRRERRDAGAEGERDGCR